MTLWNMVRHEDRTDLYNEAKRALSELAEAENFQKMELAFGEISSIWRKPSEERQYRESRGRVCIGRLIDGKQCNHPFENSEGHAPPMHPDSKRLMIRKDNGALVYLMENLDLSWDDIQALVDFARDNGLEMDLSAGRARYWPSRTIQARFSKAS